MQTECLFVEFNDFDVRVTIRSESAEPGEDSCTTAFEVVGFGLRFSNDTDELDALCAAIDADEDGWEEAIISARRRAAAKQDRENTMSSGRL